VKLVPLLVRVMLTNAQHQERARGAVGAHCEIKGR
jgi:hypothetical protein